MATRIYSGPFDPPPAESLKGAIGWRHRKVTDDENPGRWKPSGWMIVYPDHILQVGLDGLADCDSLLYAP